MSGMHNSALRRSCSILLALVCLLVLCCSTVSFAENGEVNADKTFADVVDSAEVLVAGPSMSRNYISAYVSGHPDILPEAAGYLNILYLVQHFTQAYPDAENYNTYDALTGLVRDIPAGYCVTFHQNLAADDPFGGYTDLEYALMCAITVRELDADTVNIGYFGNPEVSFVCMDKEKALRFAVEHNQNSIYCVTTDETLVNPKWDWVLNPIEGVDLS